jgi:hypothetical protein
MPLIIPSNSISDGGYVVDNSLRFDDGSSDYLDRTGGTATDGKKFTYSAWFKRGNLGSGKELFCIYADNTNRLFLRNNGDTFELNLLGGFGSTTREFRDPSAWYHFVIACDSTQATASDRGKWYLNGELIMTGSISLNQVFPHGQSTPNFIIGNGEYNNTIYSNHWDGYQSEVCFIDGQQLAPSDFGEFDEDSGIWKPIDVSGLTFGTNGFYLDFENSGSLGADVSGNGNNFTVNNLTSIDQTTDTPTNNFATMNPLAITNAGNTFSEGNLKITTTSGASSYNQATIGVSTGKWFWEVKYVSDTDGSGNYARIGIADIDPPNTGGLGETEGIAYEAINGKYKIRGSATTYGDTYAPGDIIGVALNLDDNELIFYKNGTAQNSGTAIDISSYTPKTGFWHPAFNYDDGSNSGVFEINFGSPSFAISSGNSDGNGYGNFEYSVPSGYYALNTKNLAEYG